MSLLGYQETQQFDATRNPDGMLVRPVYGMHISVTSDAVTDCVDQNLLASPCHVSETWLDQVKVLTSDIFTGNQHSLE